MRAWLFMIMISMFCGSSYAHTNGGDSSPPLSGGFTAEYFEKAVACIKMWENTGYWGMANDRRVI